MCDIVHSADIQDRDGGLLLMSLLCGLYPFLLKLYADSGYQGPKFKNGLKRVDAGRGCLAVRDGQCQKRASVPAPERSPHPKRSDTGIATPGSSAGSITCPRPATVTLA